MSANNEGHGFQALVHEFKSLRQTVMQHDKALMGNGREGLIQTVARMESSVNGMVRSGDRINDIALRMEITATKMETHLNGVSRLVGALQKKVSDLESLVRPIIEWKKGILLRVSTIAATSTVIFGALWWAIENKDKVKAFFQ